MEGVRRSAGSGPGRSVGEPAVDRARGRPVPTVWRSGCAVGCGLAQGGRGSGRAPVPGRRRTGTSIHRTARPAGRGAARSGHRRRRAPGRRARPVPAVGVRRRAPGCAGRRLPGPTARAPQRRLDRPRHAALPDLRRNDRSRDPGPRRPTPRRRPRAAAPHTHQRRAVLARDSGCAVDGCDAAPWLCGIHHLIHWTDGGPTDLDNLAMVCRWHHRKAHTNGWHLGRDPDGTIRCRPVDQHHRTLAA